MHKFLNRFTLLAIGALCFGMTSVGGSNRSVQAITFAKILDLNAPIPGRPGETFGTYRLASTDGTTVVFIGVATFGTNTSGIYTMPIAGGPVTKIADNFTAAPGGGGNFSSFALIQVAPFVSNGKVTFYGTLATAGAAGIYSAPATGG
ncbi:MAG: hypothetical protein WCD18_11795, partial [Thermosynechococcaceae cyanobacterium]